MITTPKPDLRLVRTMPVQKPGKSKQDYGTPDDFFMALSKRFGVPDVDLAATDENSKCKHWVTPEQDSLKNACDWDAFHDAGSKLAFLNPPFGEILPWAQKCADSERLPILFLVPASVGSNWWARYVHDRASHVLFLRGRLEFEGAPCTRRKGKVQICQHDASEHAAGGCKRCDCSGFCKDGYPKDCALVHYVGPSRPPSLSTHAGTVYTCWDWKGAST